jgi:glyoxylase-like metal-dependent hydrolase (beta-lactamase superfamily II)
MRSRPILSGILLLVFAGAPIAQAPRAIAFDHVHLGVPDPQSAYDWYLQYLDGRPAEFATRRVPGLAGATSAACSDFVQQNAQRAAKRRRFHLTPRIFVRRRGETLGGFMTRFVRLVLVLAVAGGCARPTPEMQVVNDAAEALGGSQEKFQTVDVIVMEGSGMSNAIGQARTPQGDDLENPAEPTAVWKVTGLKRTIDVARGLAGQQMRRSPDFPSPQPDGVVNVGLDKDIAYTVGGNGQASRQPAAAAKARRWETILSHPIGIVRAALDPAAKVSNARQDGSNDLVDIATATGENVTLAVDRTTHLPQSVSTAGSHDYLGDITNKTEFHDYQDVDGVKLPGRIVTKVGNWLESDYRVTSRVNMPTAYPGAPDSVKIAPVPSGQPQAPNIPVEQVAKGIWFLTGGSHNSTLVEFADHAELIEVPNGDTRTLAVIAKAREILPTKPLTKAIVTHHHYDHSGGIRAAVSEGLTLVTHEANKAFFEQMMQRKHTMDPDALAKNTKPVQIETVGDAGATVKDAMREMQILKFDDPTGHNAYMLMVWFPKERILVNADLYNRAENFARYPRALTLEDNLKRLKLNPAIHLPVHGRKSTQAEFEDVVKAIKEGRRPAGLRSES